MTDVVVTQANDSFVIQQQRVQNVVIDDKRVTVVVTGQMPPANIASISALTDVDLSQLQNGSVLIYNSDTQKWTATNTLDKQIFEAGQF